MNVNELKTMSDPYVKIPAAVHVVLCCVVLLLNVHGQQLRSCWDGQLT